MSPGGGAMVRGGLLSSNKGAPEMEGAFTERNDATEYPQNFDEAYNNVPATIEMIEKDELREDMLSTIEWAKPINFQNDYDSIIPNHQVAESTYLSSKTTCTVRFQTCLTSSIQG